MPSGDHCGWKIDSATPPATRRVVAGDPSAPIPASHNWVPTQGMFGWSHVSQASRLPSGDRQGEA
jgi:hypothetical protein